MQQFLQYTILGLVVGGVYVIAASGLVVTYTTSGIFNFAHGAIAMLARLRLLAGPLRLGLAGPDRADRRARASRPRCRGACSTWW